MALLGVDVDVLLDVLAGRVLLGIGYVFWPRVVAIVGMIAVAFVVIVELSLAAIISK